MTTLNGIVTDITFQNEDTGFTVLKLQAETDPSPVVCVGVLPTVAAGSSITARGTWRRHERFGPQFEVESYELVRPTTGKAVYTLLSSGLIANIGPSRAKKIVDRFGVDTIAILDRNPEKLREIPGIGVKILNGIKEAWNSHKSIHDLMLFLQEYGITVNLAAKIYAAYGKKAKEVISLNPFTLIDDIWGVGFKKADAIARKLGYEHDSYKRIRAGLIVCLQNAVTDGHCYLPEKELIHTGASLLDVPEEMTTFSLDHLITSQQVIHENGNIFLPALYRAEKFTAEVVQSRCSSNGSMIKEADTGTFENWLKTYYRRTGFAADPKQADAIRGIISNSTFLLTGGPGTGKTTLLQVVVSYLREHNHLVSLAAPTGRAAQRMGSISGLKAQTLHRLLEFRRGKKGAVFSRNRDNPLLAETVIIDEVSMIDIFLMSSLLQALKPSTRLVLVGDNHQLPSVGPGNVLSDLIASKKIPHVHLSTIFRQAAQSKIVQSAHQIIRGAAPHFANDQNDNCFFIEENDPEKSIRIIVDLVAHRLPKSYSLDPVADIQVLAPMHKGILGTQNLNSELQRVLNTGGERIIRGDRAFSRGDKVMQVRNNYDREVFNGDIGFITGISPDSVLNVDFGNKTATYSVKDLDELVQAYCISIHKSQGCEFKAVVIPCTTRHYIMLKRNLIYTALTRARELCVFVGMKKALAMAIRNNEALSRYSMLARRIQVP
ncbi:MAG: ATP-dependent RecD-like DNA helicase [Chitinivibrionales bacterium]|nr:ATP-dependent RecD-like DNA helicase [Chitinivibrionales bacterium]